jgi:hypothetical protein
MHHQEDDQKASDYAAAPEASPLQAVDLRLTRYCALVLRATWHTLFLPSRGYHGAALAPHTRITTILFAGAERADAPRDRRL